jgi:hypothetical protein
LLWWSERSPLYRRRSHRRWRFHHHGNDDVSGDNVVVARTVCGEQVAITLTPGKQQIVIDTVFTGEAGNAGPGPQGLFNEVEFERHGINGALPANRWF